MDIKKPITSTISSASFSFLTAEDIRSISVKQIINPVLLDTTNHPNAGGLYDPALGPMRPNDICSTCHLNSYQCPGHFGHIELPSPVFHPLFMGNMFNLLRGTCFYCHRFRANLVVLTKVIGRLRLLELGLVDDAENIEAEEPRSHAKASDLSNDDFDSANEDDEDKESGKKASGSKPKGFHGETPAEFATRINKQVKELIKAAKASGKAQVEPEAGSLAYTARKKCINDFMKDIYKKRCGQCNAISPLVRRDGFLKIMEKAPTNNEVAANDQKGYFRISPVKRVAAMERRLAASAASTSAAAETEDEVDIASQAISADNAPKEAGYRVMPAVECQAHLRLLFHNECPLCSLIFGRNGPFRLGNSAGKVKPKVGSSIWSTPNGASADNFFVGVLAVPPTRFRPASIMGDMTFENSQNELLTNVLKTTFVIRDQITELARLSAKKDFPELGPDASETEYRAAEAQLIKSREETRRKVLNSMMQLQVDVNSFIDASKNPMPLRQGQLPPPGVKQGLEKKEGLFRKHMMGKRVNFAARSVISPDVNIETNEIGVPPVFARKLTYPEPVTVHNVQLMRQLVINGPSKYPGAVAIRSEDGTETQLDKLSVEERTALANQLLTPQEHSSKQARGTFAGLGSSTRTPIANKQVLRHLRDGDILLLNRQPTLHRPSMMAHKARVLVGEKTIRMHYANCNSYNADFDGDEMNMHFPQSQAARAECYYVANTDNQYLTPTSGNPLRGLIQDHVVAGVWMTSKNTLYTRAEYQQILYGALRPEGKYTGSGRVLTVGPALLKPEPLWTGKQVISTVLLNLKPAKADGLNLTSKAKVAGRMWGKDHASEEKVIIEDGELLQGVLDKAAFGASSYGLVHAIFEIYGSETAGKLLSILSRLFTKFLQTNAFSCRMDDLLLSKDGDKDRRDLLNAAKDQGKGVAMKTVGLEGENEKNPDTDRNLRIRLEEVLRDDNKLAVLDGEMMGSSNGLSTKIIDTCLPAGLYKKFPENNMQMMTGSGAKGSAVNVSQISCLLGQQALEGRRVPLMVSGKSLPSFRPFDTSARAGGFVSGRFLTGIRPQEYFFHCMAGREGLIDTAVKTSRSGYLQRCLIKHLEGVHVQYDNTVRNADGSILQFNYGEDALDTTKSKYIGQFDFTAANFENYNKRYDPKQLGEVVEAELAAEHMKKALKKPHKYDPVLSVYTPSTHFGSMSEKYAKEIEAYIEKNPSKLLADKKKKSKKRKSEADAGAQDGASAVEKLRFVKEKLGVEAFRAMCKVLYHRGLVDPGEAVGLLAAQGVGEPSTQMTLNTFHFAGHGAANVTLGIPRLREIVMTASQHIKTPIMRLPVLEGITADQIKTFCKDGSRLVLSQVIDEAVVTEKISPKSEETGYHRQKTYTVRLNFYPADECKEEYNCSTSHILRGLQETFAPNLENSINNEMRKQKREHALQAAAIGKGQTFSDNAPAGENDDEAERATGAVGRRQVGARGNDADSDDDEDASSDVGDGDADDAKRKQKSAAAASYEEGDDEDMDAIPSTTEDIEAAFSNGNKKKSTAPMNLDSGSDSDSDSDDGSINEEWAEQTSALERALQENSKYINAFRFDDVKARWAEFDLTLATQSQKLLLINIVERVCRQSVIHEIPNIARVMKPPPKAGEEGTSLTAEGINFRDLWDFGFGVVDLDNLYTNDIGAVLHTYGVEAARAAIVAEMRGIFDTYGIAVSPRHLFLIADYQTAAGGFRPFNRSGIAESSSTLLKASFEMTMAFIGGSALHGDVDMLKTPSSKLVVGRPVSSGTGTPEIRLALPAPIGAAA
ncbi:RNA polymerase, alpha subunit [Kalmanozyma brasiliensis GHG001]|uniref:DNA-directed RNA polymerase subunit n=1 Tax=Kalmanozyma brasiliensis (strain GHG001) TaxID=1365824 RepID=V5EU38_KALBG|nr:RNA polymerase, alpha subunit [Kalmanozyma brasiliensis GHG001]EST05564.1 RNA polymerase, alpha subunit [Kalmanozyma brasiliensis GHG001]